MDSKNLQFLQKLEALPEEVSVFFYSEKIEDRVKTVSQDYGLELDLVNNLLLDFFVEDFNFKKIENIISKKIANKNILNEFICDFYGKIFLPIAPFIKVDLEKEIKAKGGQIDSYSWYVDDFNDFIENKNLDSLGDLVENLEKNIDIEEEERLSNYFLEKDLVQILTNKDVYATRKINGSIIYILLNTPLSSAKFTRSFLANQEKLTKDFLIINNKKEEPTISNWIKSFIKENGSDNFSNIVLAKFLTSSVNCLNLNEDERRLVRKTLRLYRNLAFFPDSMANIPLEEWEIIPIDKFGFTDDSMSKQRKSISATNKNVNEDDKKMEVESRPVSEKDQKLKDLNLMLEKYPNKSLERKAIENEIKKLNSK